MGAKKGDMVNVYSPSSHMSRAINMEVWYGRLLCPNGHQDKSLLNRVGLGSHWKCNICKRSWWAREWKYPKDTSKSWR